MDHLNIYLATEKQQKLEKTTIRWGHGAQYCYSTSALDGVVLHFTLIGAEMTPVLVCLCAGGCTSRGSAAMPAYLPPSSQPGAWQLCRAFIPSPSSGMQGISPRHSWSERPSSSYSHAQIHTPPQPPSCPPPPTTLNSNTTDRHRPKSRHLALQHTHTLGNLGESQGSAETL